MRQTQWAGAVCSQPLLQALAVKRVCAVGACHFLTSLKFVQTHRTLVSLCGDIEYSLESALMLAQPLQATQIATEDQTDAEYKHSHDDQWPGGLAAGVGVDAALCDVIECPVAVVVVAVVFEQQV